MLEFGGQDGRGEEACRDFARSRTSRGPHTLAVSRALPRDAKGTLHQEKWENYK